MLSTDNVAVLIHDETLERTTDGRGEVARTMHAALKPLDAGAWFDPRFRGEPIPDFADAAQLCVRLGLWANIEIKPAPGHEHATGRIAAGIADRAWAGAARPLQPLLSSFSETALASARDTAPQLPRALLVDAVPPDWERRLTDLGCIALNCNQARLEESAARAIRASGYGLAAWTVNDPTLARRLFSWGVDAIFTDQLDLIGPDFAEWAA